MIKLVYCVRRRADVSREEFFRYWLENHGALFTGLARTLRGRRYVQSHATEIEANKKLDGGRGMGEPFDGITEVWWDSLEDLMQAMDTPEGREAAEQLQADEAKFVDFSESRLMLTEEHEVFDFTS